MRKLLILLLLSAALTGCREEIPSVVAANVVDGGLFMGQFALNVDGRPPEEWSLNSSQIVKLDTWLQHHRDGWNKLLVSPPPPSLSVVLTHPDGTHSRVDFFNTSDYWKHTVVVHAPSASDNGTRNLSTQDTQELLLILQKNS